MPKKTSLENAIAKAAGEFAMQIVEAVKDASLQELMALQEGKPKRRGRKPGPKPKARKKPGPKPKAKRGPGRPKKKVVAKKKVAPKKKRVVRNYPKCAFPSCKKNRFPRGKGFCGEHWRKWKDGKIKDASAYKKK
jgi:hypothetical protein